MTLDLTEDEKLALLALLKRTIEDDPYPLSPARARPERDTREAGAASPRHCQAFPGSPARRSAARCCPRSETATPRELTHAMARPATVMAIARIESRDPS